ncbi:hypothetical protein FOIG_12901 [Fusarium odoratissimum NRRL 54006]|uniref:Uncharacterized protein n=2 Tax=Fusarium oxysporum species complex TaxID=171631 RepID=X0IZH8_FUSO5|nr:uncharacterized protein FOIG_12901 [Fusarium odoratissimum NRRL 54006]EXL94343.1 hypothetical protein FOIG_12901 [Fusarium odoratissimum NRRL 54006]TXC10830.1 hypothetical protein FocTR4_00006991 [Fusarium oxysporum f. sp. cubense]
MHMQAPNREAPCDVRHKPKGRAFILGTVSSRGQFSGRLLSLSGGPDLAVLASQNISAPIFVISSAAAVPHSRSGSQKYTLGLLSLQQHHSSETDATSERFFFLSSRITDHQSIGFVH